MNTPVASVPSPGLPPEAVAVQQRMDAAKALLDAWWGEHGADCASAYEDVYRAVLAAAVTVKTSTLLRRLDAHAATGRRFTRTSLLRTPVKPGARRKLPRTPARRRPVDREEQARVRAVVQPFWAEYGPGWCQDYAVVFGIARSILRTGTSAEDLSAALALLGPRGMPVSAAVVRIALRNAAHTRTAEADRDRLASYRTADAYTVREM